MGVFFLSSFAIIIVFFLGVALYWGFLGFDDSNIVARNYALNLVIIAGSFIVPWLAAFKIAKSKLADGRKAILLAIFVMINIILLMVVSMAFNLPFSSFFGTPALLLGILVYLRVKKLPGVYTAGVMSVVLIYGGFLAMMLLG